MSSAINLHKGGIFHARLQGNVLSLAGRMATAIEALDATTGALVTITEKLKLSQQATEDMFISSGEKHLYDKNDKADESK